MVSAQPWKPKYLRRVAQVRSTSMRTAEVVTDAGPAFLKALGNPEGPHALACEWIASQLARWFGLRTFDFALMNLDETVPIEFPEGGLAQPGPAFVSRTEAGHPWGGTVEELEKLLNPNDIYRLVVFDTWIRNRDRHSTLRAPARRNTDNVFLSTEGCPSGRTWITAMDHTHCFTSGTLKPTIAHIDQVRDPRLYGAFPEFERFHDLMVCSESLEQLRKAEPETIRPMIESVPAEWDLNQQTRNSLLNFLVDRASFLVGLGIDHFCPGHT